METANSIKDDHTNEKALKLEKIVAKLELEIPKLLKDKPRRLFDSLQKVHISKIPTLKKCKKRHTTYFK